MTRELALALSGPDLDLLIRSEGAEDTIRCSGDEYSNVKSDIRVGGMEVGRIRHTGQCTCGTSSFIENCSSRLPSYGNTWIIQLNTTGRNVPPSALHASAV